MAAVDVNDFVKNLERSRSRFMYGLDCVPDDRLKWSPGGSAKSALELGDRVAGFLGFLSAMVAGKDPGPRGEQPAGSESRDEAKGRINGAFEGLKSTVSGLSDEDLASSRTLPWGEVTTVGALLPGVMSVVGYFQGQLNYLQLAYGDENPNIPPDWHPHE